jgi:hypothetical protein
LLLWVVLRMMVYLSACFASSGSSSPMLTPATLVCTARRNGPL